MIKLEIKFIFKTVNNRDWWNNRVDTDADEHSHLKRSRFVPYFGLTYDLNENNSLYLSYTSIFKPNSSIDRDGNVLKPVLGKIKKSAGKANGITDSLMQLWRCSKLTKKTALSTLMMPPIKMGDITAH
ncbi:TonB-dependent receptor [Glaesserella parasuis]|uniref:TonB-dependent receptor domain-containing protein n=1 Tax=Glaesserella parasuis TaxID=738 RepID=UPI002436DF9A|nr:TonB-dependent receptor [Glaesserella parasuis]MDG6242229.1 TonB-dependent receptor [Glaesserella parasuis]MDO9818327.1 TonB-dependent receptor [Glaesserella parasuis]MDO9828932.1 TonB-dependent receptor [Glaesserella parasuis]MDP0064332.1 TonB-dependent receptor [Glaesserella parasuis]MDP0076947.1 TonB-dependent receptor [Glaesserella parasuis]